MSIASRITAIEEHIRDVYDTIDYSYDTTEVDKNIINIPQNIFNGYINVLNDNGQSLWNALEKVSQADITEAELSNVVTAPMKIDLKGNTSQEADPTPDDPKDIKVVKGENVVSVQGKNLLGLINGTYSHNGITAVVNDGTITITGTATANSFVNIPLIKDIILSNEQVTASINNATTISDTATEFRVYESGNNYIPVQFTTIDRKTTITKSGTFASVYVRTSSGVSYDNGLVIKPQLEYGSTATPYVPYSKTDYTINLGNIELCKINTYKDYFHKDSGKWYVHKEIEKTILNGSENWARSQYGTTGNYYYRYANSGLGQQTQDGKLVYSNYFSPKNTWSERVQGIWFDINLIITTNGSINNTETLEDFISWLSTHNTIVYYILATPTEEEITNTTLIEQLEAISKAKSVKDKTFITQTNYDLPFILDVEAIKEYTIS